MNTLVERQARKLGYTPLTRLYVLPDERWMLDKVIADMRRGPVDFVLVRRRKGLEVWRRLTARHCSTEAE